MARSDHHIFFAFLKRLARDLMWVFLVSAVLLLFLEHALDLTMTLELMEAKMVLVCASALMALVIGRIWALVFLALVLLLLSSSFLPFFL